MYDITLADGSSKFLDLRVFSNSQLSSREFLDTNLWLCSFWKLSEPLDEPFFSFEGQYSIECVTKCLLRF